MYLQSWWVTYYFHNAENQSKTKFYKNYSVFLLSRCQLSLMLLVISSQVIFSIGGYLVETFQCFWKKESGDGCLGKGWDIEISQYGLAGEFILLAEQRFKEERQKLCCSSTMSAFCLSLHGKGFRAVPQYFLNIGSTNNSKEEIFLCRR